MYRGKRDTWREVIKPVLVIATAIAGWVISMIFFVIGFSFGSQMMFGNYDVAFPVAITVGLFLTVIELAWNDEKEDLLDWAIWIFAYALGIASNFYGLSLILGMADANVEKIIAISLGSLIEIAPERMLIRGMRNLNIEINILGFVRSLFGDKKQRNNNQNQPKNQSRVEPSYHNLNTSVPKPKPQHRPASYPGPNDFQGGA